MTPEVFNHAVGNLAVVLLAVVVILGILLIARTKR